MDLIQSIIMGIIQGLSEFLPISSSAHLVISSNFYKYFNHFGMIRESNQEVFLDIMLHLGTLIAVLIYFRKDIYNIIKSFAKALQNKDFSDSNFKIGLYIIIGTILTAITAILLEPVSSRLVFKPEYVGILLVFTGGLLLFSEYYSKKIPNKSNLTLKKSLLIGLAQGLASLPGFSRSGLTISAGLFMGLDRETSARYSFLLSIPIILGSSLLYPLIMLDLKEVASYNWTSILTGAIISALVGYFCIKYFLKFISKFSLAIFGYYCIIMGIFTAVFFYLV